MLLLVIAGSSVVAAATTSSEAARAMNPSKYNDPSHLFRQFERKLIDYDYVSCKNVNRSRTNAAHESLLTMTSRATQHAGNIVDSYSTTTSSSLHNAMLFKSEPLSPSRGSASSLPTGTQAETPIAGSDRMILRREDVLLSSSFSKRTCTLEKMKSAFVVLFLFLFYIMTNYFFWTTLHIFSVCVSLILKCSLQTLLFQILNSWHTPFVSLSFDSVYSSRWIDRWWRQQHLRLHRWWVHS